MSIEETSETSETMNNNQFYQAMTKALIQKGFEIKGNEKLALSFYIDQLSKDNRQHIIQQGIDFMQHNDKLAIQHYFAPLFKQEYIYYLQKRIQNEVDNELIQKLETLKRMAEKSLKFIQIAINIDEPVPFGGVPMEFCPNWEEFMAS